MFMNGGDHVMSYGCMGYNGVGKIYFIDVIKDAKMYWFGA